MSAIKPQIRIFVKKKTEYESEGKPSLHNALSICYSENIRSSWKEVKSNQDEGKGKRRRGT